ncbi:MAG: polysulfide reductase NrfD [Gemmatimonadetes bacterium]|jgi:molybdopterin-containing oxidoreductase family membrane subunit|nr:polysulfide reductase NrfD [Gemmatimonadota bacterium]MBT4609526.1 polysulfide reductase NrfD [Gemmatimonadota bacterium]MBT5059815.1 polysulfide reductase NrfD [Gemmatimonadota bacterium]MBT5141865.1 polysulfide reductase NrfD [Gemmatimonadota bacterium]MBT5589846.1 polysulfide reductase NrfD [Gemmatimonadota bacterium]
MSEARKRRPYEPPPSELGPGQTSYTSITDKISSVVFTPHTPIQWFIVVGIGLCLIGLLQIAIAYLLYQGTGIWGLNIPVGWGFAIINFVWWIGIGHAGTLISAVLLLFRQKWRTSINRSAEAMTIFAVLCAGMFPVLHTGRPWLAIYWLFPYPNSMAIWPQFRSPLIWDVFAVGTYLTVSLLFWGVGLIPDFATYRDKARHLVTKRIFGFLSLGWRGSAIHWERYEMASLILAGLSTPLVLSVHSVVSFDFAVSIIPGWHTTIFPPYFVAGAIYAGFAMVLTLMLPLRALYGLHDFITDRHLDNMGKVMLVAGMIVGYGYFMEQFMAWYSASIYENFLMENRMFGPYGGSYWALLLCNIIVPQLLWAKRVRTSPYLIFMVSMFINVGMWLERFIIVVGSMHRDYMPSSWDMYSGTIWDWSLYLGTMGFFLVAFFLFVRAWPLIAIHEIRTLLPTGKKH